MIDPDRTHDPETQFVPIKQDPLSLRDIRRIVEQARDMIRECVPQNESICIDGDGDEYLTADELCDDLRQAESQLYQLDVFLRLKGIVK
jgi:arsenate reductase-like glutaredoxin family protein